MKKALRYQFKDNLGMNIVGFSGFGDWKEGDIPKIEKIAKQQALERFDNGLKNGLKGKALILETLVSPYEYNCLDKSVTPLVEKFRDRVCDAQRDDYKPNEIKKIFDKIEPKISTIDAYDEFVNAYNQFVNEFVNQTKFHAGILDKNNTKYRASGENSDMTWYAYIGKKFEKVFSKAKDDFSKLLENQYDEQKLKDSIVALIDETNSAILLNSMDEKENSPYSIAPNIDSPICYPSIYLIYGLALNAIDGEKVSEQKFDTISKAKKKISGMSVGAKVGIGLAGLGVFVGLAYYLTKPKATYPQNYPPQNYPPQNYPNQYPR